MKRLFVRPIYPLNHASNNNQCWHYSKPLTMCRTKLCGLKQLWCSWRERRIYITHCLKHRTSIDDILQSPFPSLGKEITARMEQECRCSLRCNDAHKMFESLLWEAHGIVQTLLQIGVHYQSRCRRRRRRWGRCWKRSDLPKWHNHLTNTCCNSCNRDC
jgi:hypothetical protein